MPQFAGLAPVGPAAVHLPTPDKQSTPLARMLRDGQILKLNAEQLAGYLRDHHYSAEAMLTVSRLTDDLALLRQAVQKFPNDPGVQLEVAARGQTPDERKQALEAFRKIEPDNALGDYLAAMDHFQRGQSDAAIDDLWLADAHAQFEDHSLEMVQSSAEAYLSAGYTAAEARTAAWLGLQRMQAIPLRDLSRVLLDLQSQYTQRGDGESAKIIQQMGLKMGQRVQDQSGFLIDDLNGMSIAERFLKQMPSEMMIGNDGQTVDDRLMAIQGIRGEVKNLIDASRSLFFDLNESEIIAYFDRQQLYGEMEALRWLIAKRSPSP